jgi:glycosyltransferase involved in cell wall biosynthesis
MEAMAVGVPVVATSIAGIPELAVNGQTALAVPPGNVEALAGAIERLLRDAQLREAMIASGRRRVEERHNRHRNVPRLFELFANQREVADEHV